MATLLRSARDRLVPLLARHPRAAASDLARLLDVSVPTLHRLLAEVKERVLASGGARRTRYALRRELRGDAREIPLYEIDEEGHAAPVARLALTHPTGSWMKLPADGWPVPEDAKDGWWGGLPYPLYDMRPQGFMGRQFARLGHRDLGVPDDPTRWNDDDIAHVLRLRGGDVSGNLILGEVAFDRWMDAKVSPPEPLTARQAPGRYEEFATHALTWGGAGSSAGGEFPKFSALRELQGSATPHVLVKFSGADDSPTVRRWSDLLVCEHLALESLTTLPGIASAKSRILQSSGRTFLEVERFDRHGLWGRSRLASAGVLDGAFLGQAGSDWTLLAHRLAERGWLSPEDVARIEKLWWFGRLIANTDMHDGNLSFRPHPTWALAPAYDMLPMLYAPLSGGEVPTRQFQPSAPRPDQHAAWRAACPAAVNFWQRVGEDARISAPFRKLALENADVLSALADRI